MQHASGKSGASADADDDSREDNLVGLLMHVTRVDAGREPMTFAIFDIARGRGNRLEVWKGGKRCLSGLAPALFAVARKWPVEQQGDVAVIAEQQVGAPNDPPQNFARTSVPALPKVTAPISIERHRDSALCSGFGRIHRGLRRYSPQRAGNPRQAQSLHARAQSAPVPQDDG